MSREMRHLCIVANIDSYYRADTAARLKRLSTHLRLVARMSSLETLNTGIVFERRISGERAFEDQRDQK